VLVLIGDKWPVKLSTDTEAFALGDALVEHCVADEFFADLAEAPHVEAATLIIRTVVDCVVF